MEQKRSFSVYNIENNQRNLANCIINMHKNLKLHEACSKSHLASQWKLTMKMLIQVLPILEHIKTNKQTLRDEELRLDIQFVVSNQYITSNLVETVKSIAHLFPIISSFKKKLLFFLQRATFQNNSFTQKVSKLVFFMKTILTPPMLNNTPPHIVFQTMLILSLFYSIMKK